MSLLQVQKFRGKTGDTMADKNYLHTAYANNADGKDGFTTVYPNLNLAPHTELLMDKSNKFIWGAKGGTTNSITYEEVKIPNNQSLINGIRTTQISTGQSGWRGPGYNQDTTGSIPCKPNTQYTASTWIKNNATNPVNIILQIGVSAVINQTAPKYLAKEIIVPPDGNWHYISYTAITNTDSNYMWPYVYTANGTSSADFTFAGYKLEQGSTATPWMPSATEVTTADWPKYVGTYVDTNPVSSTDPSKYGWDEMKYRVYLDGVAVGGSKLLSFDLENLKAGTSYNVQVNQINGNDESDKSESVAFKTSLTK